ncbi:hypothetical protein THRCLA_04111, partial [Thraustotheca clavata]
MSIAELSATQKEELATSVAVLLLTDAEVEVSADNINAALKASKNKFLILFIKQAKVTQLDKLTFGVMMRRWTIAILVFMSVHAADIKIKRKVRPVREPVALREPAAFRTGVLDEKTEPVTKYASINNDMGDIALNYFHNITHTSTIKKTLLGRIYSVLRRLLWKGYEVDEITLKYHAMIFDDGDICPHDKSKRYSVRLELNRQEYEGMREYIQTVETTSIPCQYKMKLDFHCPPERMLVPPDGYDHIVSWYEDPASPKVMCKSIKCDYTFIQDQFDAVSQAIQQLQLQIEQGNNSTDIFIDSTLLSATSILSASNQ